jgi:hypothetical protein
MNEKRKGEGGNEKKWKINETRKGEGENCKEMEDETRKGGKRTKEGSGREMKNER